MSKITVAEVARQNVHRNTVVDELLKKVSGFRHLPERYAQPVSFLDKAESYKQYLHSEENYGAGASLITVKRSERAKQESAKQSSTYKSYAKQVPVIGGGDMFHKVVMVKDISPDQHVVNASKGDNRKIKTVDFHPELIKVEGAEVKRRVDAQRGIVAGSKSKAQPKKFTGGTVLKLTAKQRMFLKKASK
jgi:hypothetical protein